MAISTAAMSVSVRATRHRGSGVASERTGEGCDRRDDRRWRNVTSIVVPLRYIEQNSLGVLMQLTAVYARFFRSLNFDFMKRASSGYKPLPWDEVPGGAAPYPFVKVAIDEHITTIVGANESGKSQVLAAIEFGLTGEKVLQRDFCRYSPFFLRHKDLLLPEFGLRFSGLTDADLPLLGEALGQKLDAVPEELAVFRMNTTPKARVYLRNGADWAVATVKKPSALEQLGMPSVFKIDAGVPLPDSVPIRYVATGQKKDAMPHAQVRSGLDMLFGAFGMVSSPTDFEANRESLRSSLTLARVSRRPT
ncbi:MAG: hypothetical protein K0Q52_1418 [Microbacterium sp.]|jgi:hypothetical protein|nr:hypothetical protein [Microbacterium sp.]